MKKPFISIFDYDKLNTHDEKQRKKLIKEFGHNLVYLLEFSWMISGAKDKYYNNLRYESGLPSPLQLQIMSPQEIDDLWDFYIKVFDIGKEIFPEDWDDILYIRTGYGDIDAPPFHEHRVLAWHYVVLTFVSMSMIRENGLTTEILDNVLYSHRRFSVVIELYEEHFKTDSYKHREEEYSKNERKNLSIYAANIRHVSNRKIKEEVLSKYNEKKWASKRQAAKELVTTINIFCDSNKIPRLSIDRCQQTIYEWILKETK